MRITEQTRDELFTLLQKSQELHREVCRFLVEPTEELEQKIVVMINQFKEIAREI